MSTQTRTQTATPAPTTDAGSLSLRGRQPLKQTGVLDQYESFDVTPVIGREYTDVQLSALLAASNSDDLIRELAVIVSERGVAFFRAQDINIHQQKELGRRLGKLSGSPKESGLHTHPVTKESSELGDEVTVISSDSNQAYKDIPERRTLARNWHSDITFEPVPSDFAILKIHTLPSTGGDTLWASAYEAYDRLTPAYAAFLEGLTATHSATWFHSVAAKLNVTLRTTTRGNPLNSGPELTTVHPVIRTNPVTGWKGVFVNRGFTTRINELSPDESEQVLEHLYRTVTDNHDLQVRFKWGKDDVAIWANSSTVHNATPDYGSERRVGDRVVSIGERPFFDPGSVSRRTALEERAKTAGVKA